MAWLPEQKLLLCGDTMEDPITYVDQPRSFDAHLTNLAKLSQLAPNRILPSHGDPEAIADGGYSADLIGTTKQYIEMLIRCRTEPELRELSLRELMSGSLDAGRCTTSRRTRPSTDTTSKPWSPPARSDGAERRRAGSAPAIWFSI